MARMKGHLSIDVTKDVAVGPTPEPEIGRSNRLTAPSNFLLCRSACVGDLSVIYTALSSPPVRARFMLRALSLQPERAKVPVAVGQYKDP